MSSVIQNRNSFLEYFKSKNHTIVDSSPLVPQNDPSLMFTNAGMVQFKNVFTGLEERDYKTAASSQKCVRAGGKHNDLDNVGYTARHHTFFEMLGNFSFGDYFKEEAIFYAWDFLTNIYELPKEKLYITVYHEDKEAFDIWKKLTGFSDDKIIKITTQDNFWSMGDTGPCGPCSEIFYDHGPNIKGGLPGTPDEDGDRFIEIWNLVFMQHEQLEKGKRIELPSKSIDTGMGLERISAVLQHKTDNFEIDLFQNIINASCELSKTKESEFKFSHRIIADHLRSSSFLIADGVMPSNEGRGYVLRRIMRRAMRHVHILGMKEPLMHKLVPCLISEMGEAFPELKRAEGVISDFLRLEEERFKETLDRGLKLLDEESRNLKENDELDGKTAFKLYDTYGFPLDLTKDILRSKNITVDDQGFDAAMDQQKKRAREASKGSGDKSVDEIWYDLSNKLGATEFLGYHTHEAEAIILAIVNSKEQVQEAGKGDEISIITNQTPFYGESGGQTGDSGYFERDGAKIEIWDTKKYFGKLVVHQGKILEGKVKIGDEISLHVNKENRINLMLNHSATHLLHAVLKKTIDKNISQKGSYVGPNRLRFDFSFPRALNAQEVLEIEFEVNKLIRENTKTQTRVMELEEALETGAEALFGEKYDKQVRVVTMGKMENKEYSVELCGGTHVERAGDIGLFKIINESAIASGVRRIEAITGKHALEYLLKRDELLKNYSLHTKCQPEELITKFDNLKNEKKILEKQLEKINRKNALDIDIEKEVEKINDISFFAKIFDDLQAKDLKPMALKFRDKIDSSVVLLVTKLDGKAGVVVAVSDALKDKINAVDLVKIAAFELGGKGGGGKNDIAQSGGPDIANDKKAIDAVRRALNN